MRRIGSTRCCFVVVLVSLMFYFSFSPLFRRLALCTIVEPREFNITEDANGFLVLDNERDTEQRRRIIHRNCSIGAHILTHVDAGIGIWGKAALLFFGFPLFLTLPSSGW